jgi:hypothetical protein
MATADLPSCEVRIVGQFASKTAEKSFRRVAARMTSHKPTSRGRPGVGEGIGDLASSEVSRAAVPLASDPTSGRMWSGLPIMNGDVVLEVGSEGGTITLLREKADGIWHFWVDTDETGTYEALSEEDQEGVSPRSQSRLIPSFNEALDLLDRYPWIRMSPVSIHQEYREVVLMAVRTRIGSSKDEESRDALARWITVTEEAVLPVTSQMNTEPAIVLEVVEQTKTIRWVAERIRYAEECRSKLPSKGEFWKQLVLALLTSQQRSTEGSSVDLFAQKEPFPLDLDVYEGKTDDKIRDDLKSFRFGKRVTDYLRANHKKLFGEEKIWTMIESQMERLVQQWNNPRDASNRDASNKDMEREAAHLLSDQLRGIGPKQSRNLLQELGLTRYEIPLDSRVGGWLGENLGWNIPQSDLSNAEGYEFWLDRLQSVCEVAGVLPTVFDAAAFSVGKTMPSSKSLTTRTGYVNRNGQVVVRNTRLPGTDHLQWVYQLGCSHCGQVYGANGSDIFQRKCPACQEGSAGIPIEQQ